jgi:molybdenum cofactor synthesis domain-containing protein
MALVYHRLLPVEEALQKAWESLAMTGWPKAEEVPLMESLGKVLAEPVYARVDSPPFDRSVMDGFAVHSSDVFTADEAHPVKLKPIGRAEVGMIFPGQVPPGHCLEIATGAPVPRGCDAVVMVEYTKRVGDGVLIYRGVSPGENIAQAGSDISAGDLIFRRHRVISSRELAALAAQGVERVRVYRPPSIAVFSTGNEITPAGQPLKPGRVYDVNGPATASLLREMGIHAQLMGILPDDEAAIRKSLEEALSRHDVVITSGSTSAGFGDVIYRVFDSLGKPGVLVHGLRLKPGKPTVIAVARGRLLIGLPGFPLSALMVFHLVAKPLLLLMAGQRPSTPMMTLQARVPFTLEAGRGKRELLPVQLVEGRDGLIAYPLLTPSGSASALALADGFIDIPEDREFLRAEERVSVTPITPHLKLSDLAVIGSHCPGIDRLVERLPGLEVKSISVGSWAGWEAVKRGEADIAGTHLLDESTMEYNVPILRKAGLEGRAVIVRGYARRIGLVVASGNPKRIRSIEDLLRDDVIFINRNRGSGIRTYLDLKLKPVLGGREAGQAIHGYRYEVKTHTAVAAAIEQGRADVGIAIEAVKKYYGVDFIPLGEEIYDLLINKERLSKPAVQIFLEELRSEDFQKELVEELPGYRVLPETGKVIAG